MPEPQIDQNLLKIILGDYRLDPAGIHGVSHWMRVIRYGLDLAEKTGADHPLVVLFGLLHDSCRRNDSIDRGHGRRAAAYAQQLADRNILRLSSVDLITLKEACDGHTSGLGPDYRPCPTVQTCWDADKLDLHRLGYEIDTRQLWTEAAIRRAVNREFIEVGKLVY